MSEPARDILRGLLERRVAERLGSNGALDIKSTAFFSALDFSKVIAKEYPPEFRPGTDVGNFDKEFTSEAPADSMVVQHMTETMQEKSKFEGFTYEGAEKDLISLK